MNSKRGVPSWCASSASGTVATPAAILVMTGSTSPVGSALPPLRQRQPRPVPPTARTATRNWRGVGDTPTHGPGRGTPPRPAPPPPPAPPPAIHPPPPAPQRTPPPPPPHHPPA